MTVEQINKQIAELEAKRDALLAGDWPQLGDEYWHIFDGFDHNYVLSSRYLNDSFDRWRKATHNIFRTKENAELFKEITLRAQELIGDWEPDWSDRAQLKYAIDWDHVINGPCINKNNVVQVQGATYMPEKAAETLIEEYGNRLKIWVGIDND